MLPARLREWGLAMTAELIQIQDRAGRWRFAVGVLRVVLFPSARNGRRALVIALAGLASAAGVTAAAASEVPSLTCSARREVSPARGASRWRRRGHSAAHRPQPLQ